MGVPFSLPFMWHFYGTFSIFRYVWTHSFRRVVIADGVRHSSVLYRSGAEEHRAACAAACAAGCALEGGVSALGDRPSDRTPNDAFLLSCRHQEEGHDCTGVCFGTERGGENDIGPWSPAQRTV